ncbi:MAG: sigma 54-interacting transcriptional regulator [Chlamydiota bacterium]
MKCQYVDERAEFFAILDEKLGEEFTLDPAALEEREKLLACDVLITSLPSREDPGFSARFERLEKLVRNPAGIPVVAFLSTTDRQVVRMAWGAGAYDYFVESGSLDELRLVLRRASQYYELHREVEQLRVSAARLTDFVSVVGTDEKMLAIYSFASKVAASDATVLISGETGTGKELLARAIHRSSPRAREPFVAVACSSLPETLIEAELFGHERGAFTGATAARRGRFEAAERGTIFLDEIGELSPNMQVKLLRVLQERSFERLGSNQVRSMEARIICATNRDLMDLVKAGSFRADLYYRLNTIEIKLPALRERRDDIVVLAYSFLHTHAERHRRPARRISAAAMAAFQEYEWPGNIRELQNAIERAVVVCDGPEVRIEHLPSQFAAWDMELEDSSFDEEVRAFKRRLIKRVLLAFDNNKLQAARSLKIARSSLHRLIDELEVSEPGPRDRNITN